MKRSPKSCRLENDLEPAVDRWLALNPGITWSTLVNLALRNYISEKRVLTAVVIDEEQEGASF